MARWWVFAFPSAPFHGKPWEQWEQAQGIKERCGLPVSHQWEQRGNKLGTEWEQFYIMRKHIHINPCFPCFPPFASRPAAPPQSAWLRCTRTHVAGNERVRAFPWSPLRRRQACMRVHGHLLAHDVANLLIENHYQKLPRSRLRVSPKGKSRAERLRRCFVQRAGRRRIAVDNFSRCSAQKMSNCTPPANPHGC